MATRRISFRALARLAVLAVASAACGCDPSTASGLLDRLQARTTTAAGPAPTLAAPPAAAVPPAAPAPGPVVEAPPQDTSGPPRLELTGTRRYAGGRPVGWWSERLTTLRRDGPREIYDLTLARARLCGLGVEEVPGGAVRVSAATTPIVPVTAAVPSPGGEARP